MWQVTVSTVAPSVAHIERMAPLQCALAWSLHAADDAIRRRLVPTQTDDVEQLRDAFVRLLAHRGPGHHLFVEVTLLKGINDSVEDATKLARLLEPLRASGLRDAVQRVRRVPQPVGVIEADGDVV